MGNKNKIEKVLCFFMIFVLMQPFCKILTYADEDEVFRIQTPYNNQKISEEENTLQVKMRYPVMSDKVKYVKAELGGKEIYLQEDSSYNLIGTLDLSGLGIGFFNVNIVAEDISGNIERTSIKIEIEKSKAPQIIIESPSNFDLVDGRAHIKVKAISPSGKDCGITVYGGYSSIDGYEVYHTGVNELDKYIGIPSPRLYKLTILAHCDGLSTEITRYVLAVSLYNNMKEISHVRGNILDYNVNQKEILYYKEAGSVKKVFIKNIINNTETEVVTVDDREIAKGKLSPNGAFIELEPKDGEGYYNSVYEFNNEKKELEKIGEGGGIPISNGNIFMILPGKQSDNTWGKPVLYDYGKNVKLSLGNVYSDIVLLNNGDYYYTNVNSINLYNQETKSNKIIVSDPDYTYSEIKEENGKIVYVRKSLRYKNQLVLYENGEEKVIYTSDNEIDINSFYIKNGDVYYCRNEYFLYKYSNGKNSQIYWKSNENEVIKNNIIQYVNSKGDIFLKGGNVLRNGSNYINKYSNLDDTFVYRDDDIYLFKGGSLFNISSDVYNKNDVNKDLLIDIQDLSETAKEYNKTSSSLEWNKDYDVIESGNIDLYDLVSIARLIYKIS